MNRHWSIFSVVLFAFQLSSPASAQSDSPTPVRQAQVAGKKLIEFGWDEPDTAFMRRQVAAMEQTPFDGCVFHVNAVGPNGATANFTWQGWGDRAFTEAELRPALDDLRATPFRRFTHNFLRFNTTPAKLDWFDDWIYTKTPRWWSSEGQPVKLPDAYAGAVRRAREPKAPAHEDRSNPPAAGAKPGAWLQQWRHQSKTWRGVHVMLGSSNAASDLVAELPELAALGINALVLEINYAFAFASHPELRNGGALTQEQASRLARECRARGIRPIPLFNCLGHQSWSKQTGPLLTKHPELDETPGQYPENTGIYCRSWCPQHPKVNTIVFALLDELIAAFEADAVHVGMDEVFLIASEHCPRCKGGDPAKLFAKAVNDLHAHLVGQRNVEMLLWADRLLDAATMGYGEWESARNGTHGAVDLIPKDIILCDWHYEELARYRGKPADYVSIPFLLEKGFRVWPGGWKNVPATEALLAAERKHQHERLLGHLCTTWGAVKIRDLAEWPPIRAATSK